MGNLKINTTFQPRTSREEIYIYRRLFRIDLRVVSVGTELNGLRFERRPFMKLRVP
jgi:hypothetical protein